jgi:serine/threonine-protein kinase
VTRPAAQTGDLIAGKYRIDQVLGEGGMGVVFSAVHEQLEQRVALKFLLPKLATNAEILARFVREARAAVKITSEHVARVLDVGAHEGTPYMVMELLEGEDMAQVLARRGPLPVDESVGYVLQACEAIAEAHSIGIVHRDLKPANLFLARRPTGRPIIKVLDFGISKGAAGTADALITATSAMMGSPGYMSPEQLVAAATADVRADVWSLGVVLHELLTRRLPFGGETMPEMVAGILQKPNEPMAATRVDVPPALQAVVDRCLQKERENRFSNIADLARALAPFGPTSGRLSVERIEHVLGVVGAGGGKATISIPAPPQPTDALTLLPTTSHAAIRTDRRLLFFPLVAAIVGAAVVVLAFRHHHSTTAPGGQTSAPSVLGAPAQPPSAESAPVVELTPLPPAAPVAGGAPSPAPSDAAAALPTTPPWAAGKPAPRPTAARPAPSATSSPTSGCHVVSYFDADGNKHFKQECR